MKQWTIDEVKYIITTTDNTRQMSKKLTRTKSSVCSMRHLWNCYKNKVRLDRITKHTRNLFEQVDTTPAVEDNKVVTEVPTNGEAKPSTDMFENLESAWTNFQNALMSFIETESNRKSEERVKETKDKYEKEYQRLQAIIVKMQNSSFVGALREKFGHL